MKLRPLLLLPFVAAAAVAAPRPSADPLPRLPAALVLSSDSADNVGDNVDVASGNVHVGRDESVSHDLVRVGADVVIDGRVAHDAVVINGSDTIHGEVGHDAVVVLGTNTINGRIGHDAVVVGGNLTLGPDAWVGHDAVCVGGRLVRDPHAHVGGRVVMVAASPVWSGSGLHAWWQHGLSRSRFLGFGRHMGWIWFLSLIMLGFYVLCAAALPQATVRCGDLLVQRPGAVILAAFLTLIALPLVFVLLCVTLVGIPIAILVLPSALFLFTLFGKASIYGLVGRSILRGRAPHPLLAVLLGGVIAIAVYAIPLIGLPLFFVVGFLGLGCSVATVIASRGPNPSLPPLQTPPPAPPPVQPVPPPVQPVEPSSPAPEPPPAASARVDPQPVAAAAAPLAPPAAPASPDGLPRAGFWIRTLALLIDIVLIGFIWAIIVHVVAIGPCPNAFNAVLLILAAYGAVLWKLRGATVGGIVCNLQVVRLDGRPIDWATAIVRALGCFLSLIVVGLGFIWVSFDPERQSWHDKIAGTTVVHPAARRSLV